MQVFQRLIFCKTADCIQQAGSFFQCVTFATVSQGQSQIQAHQSGRAADLQNIAALKKVHKSKQQSAVIFRLRFLFGQGFRRIIPN